MQLSGVQTLKSSVLSMVVSFLLVNLQRMEHNFK